MKRIDLTFPRVGALLGLVGLAFNTEATLIDFEDLADGTVVTSQYAGLGVTFSGGTVFQPGIIYSAGISLNESDFPPYSGQNVLVDRDGPITGSFNTLVQELSGRFTYTTPITLTIYNSLNIPVGLVTSSYSENHVSSGNPPNELFAFSYAGGISKFEIVGDPGGLSFTLDNLQFSGPSETLPDNTGPLPSAVLIALLVAHYQLGRRGGSCGFL